MFTRIKKRLRIERDKEVFGKAAIKQPFSFPVSVFLSARFNPYTVFHINYYKVLAK